MQAMKEKLNDVTAMHNAEVKAKEEEQAKKELARARMEAAHEVRLAREAEAALNLQANKATDKVVEHDKKHPHHIGG